METQDKAIRYFTEQDVDNAIAVADRVTGELDWNLDDSGASEDYINVYVNALKSALLDPQREWTLDAVLEENWDGPDGSDAPEQQPLTTAQWVRSWH